MNIHRNERCKDSEKRYKMFDQSSKIVCVMLMSKMHIRICTYVCIHPKCQKINLQKRWLSPFQEFLSLPCFFTTFKVLVMYLPTYFHGIWQNLQGNHS